MAIFKRELRVRASRYRHVSLSMTRPKSQIEDHIAGSRKNTTNFQAFLDSQKKMKKLRKITQNISDKLKV